MRNVGAMIYYPEAIGGRWAEHAEEADSNGSVTSTRTTLTLKLRVLLQSSRKNWNVRNRFSARQEVTHVTVLRVKARPERTRSTRPRSGKLRDPGGDVSRCVDIAFPKMPPTVRISCRNCTSKGIVLNV